MTNLKAYYNRQLPELGVIVEESIGIKRKQIQLIAKVLPIIEHHIYMSFRAISEFYRGINERQAGMGQGHIISANICWDAFYLIIKTIENQNIGIAMKGPISKQIENETAVIFVDDTDFVSEGEEY